MKPMKLQDLFLYFHGLYGRNNRIYVTSLVGHLSILSVTIRKLQDSVRKKHATRVLESRIANLISRIFAVAGHFFDGVHAFSLAEAMCIKYPSTGCAYCGNLICQCTAEKREQHTPQPASAEQLNWTLAEFQAFLSKVYGDANRVTGIENAINRLFAESAEIAEIEAGHCGLNLNAEELQKMYAGEIADVLAWTLAVCDIMDIDAEQAVTQLYIPACPSCERNPCNCERFSVSSTGDIRSRFEVGSMPFSRVRWDKR